MRSLGMDASLEFELINLWYQSASIRSGTAILFVWGGNNDTALQTFRRRSYFGMSFSRASMEYANDVVVRLEQEK
jgi:hypothetical protein